MTGLVISNGIKIDFSDPETFKFHKWPQEKILNLFYAPKSYVSFHSDPWIQIGVVIRKCSNRSQIINFSAPVTLKFHIWPWKIIGQLFYVTSSFVHYFIAICEFKLELQSGNTQFWSKSLFFWAVWPWNLKVDLEKQLGTSSMLLQTLCIISKQSVNSNWSYSPETLNSG